MPSSRSPRERSLISASAFSTFKSRFSIRIPVCTRSILVIVPPPFKPPMVPKYLGTKQNAPHTRGAVADGGEVRIWAIMRAGKKENQMAMGTRERREKNKQNMVAKVIKLVESLHTRERLSHMKATPQKGRKE